MVTVYLDGRRRQLSPKALVGKGGEADIYDIGSDQVLKLYKPPDDPDYVGNLAAQTGAKERLSESQTKLPAFPANLLPDRVIAPLSLARNTANAGPVVGYSMKYLKDMEVLLRLGDRQYREQGGIDGNQAVATFRDLHWLVSQVHAKSVVIGDFNDLNVLFDSSGLVYLVDADSMQFGGFYCRTFTARFVDPLLSAADHLVLVQPHNQHSDWYAFSNMLFQSLLYAGPYGGVHKPTSGSRLQHDQRVLGRITVFSPEVLYPKPALPYAHLPDELLDYFHRVYEKDLREVFPTQLLENLRWTHCPTCGAVHARPTCPVCAAPGVVKQTVVRRGAVTATQTFITRGRILSAVYQNGKLHYLYHENGRFLREGDREVVKGRLDPELRFRIGGEATLLGKRDRLLIFRGQTVDQLTTEAVGKLPIFDANASAHFWIENGQLLRNSRLGSRYLGNVLTGRTMLWAGEHFGLGFYQAGQLTRTFVYELDKPGLNDRVPLPSLPGQLFDATCVFSGNLAWLMLSLEENGRLVNRCYVVNAKGQLVAADSTATDEDHWLASGIRGHSVVGGSLYVASDEGIKRIASQNGSLLVEQVYPDTEPFVDAASQLIAGDGGIYVVSNQTITLLKIS